MGPVKKDKVLILVIQHQSYWPQSYRWCNGNILAGISNPCFQHSESSALVLCKSHAPCWIHESIAFKVPGIKDHEGNIELDCCVVVLILFCLPLVVSVVCVGGDGSVAELCHAMVLRAQLDADSPEKPVKPVLPLGIIPAGETRREIFAHILYQRGCFIISSSLQVLQMWFPVPSMESEIQSLRPCTLFWVNSVCYSLVRKPVTIEHWNTLVQNMF